MFVLLCVLEDELPEFEVTPAVHSSADFGAQLSALNHSACLKLGENDDSECSAEPGRDL